MTLGEDLREKASSNDIQLYSIVEYGTGPHTVPGVERARDRDGKLTERWTAGLSSVTLEPDPDDGSWIEFREGMTTGRGVVVHPTHTRLKSSDGSHYSRNIKVAVAHKVAAKRGIPVPDSGLDTIWDLFEILDEKVPGWFS